MSTPSVWIAFFRGINVGGNHLLPMKDLKALLEKLGATRVQTYIQSGNVVFESPVSDAVKLANAIESAIEKQFGFRSRLLLLDEKTLSAAVSRNPFTDEGDQAGKTVHLWFLEKKPPKPDLSSLEALKTPAERFVLDGSVFYLHAANGIGTSKLASRVEKALGVAATARNWNTVTKMLALLKD